MIRNGLLLLWCMSAVVCFSQTKTHVVVLGFDGMGGIGLKQATNTPNFDSFRKKGAYTYNALAVNPTSSSPNWAAMINGSPPIINSIKSNSWEREKIAKTSFCGQPEGQIFPTIFKVIRDQQPNAKIHCVYDWDAFARLANTESMDVVYDAKGEYDACRKTCELILSDKPDFLFVHFDHVDHAGHQFGHYTNEYYTSIQLADSITGAVLAALEQAGIIENTYVLITADHGGVGKGHGGLTLREKYIPWMVIGPKVVAGMQITQPVRQFDTAPTIAHMFGLNAPDCWTGAAIKSIFKEEKTTTK